MASASLSLAQFSGSVSLAGFHTSNAEASKTSSIKPDGTINVKDTSTPDNVINPAIDLLYNWNISDPAQIKFELNFSPNEYLEVASRSFTKTFLGITGNFYLSDIEEHQQAIPQLQMKVSEKAPPPSHETELRPETQKPSVTIKSAPPDIAQRASKY